MRAVVAALVALSAFVFCPAARAITQPNGVTVPTPPGCSGNKPTGLLSAFACVCTQQGVCNIGAPCTSQNSCDNGQHGTCESTMWHSFNDNTCIPSNESGLDPVADASVVPETFHPTCALTFTVVTRGTALFQNVFGWYNVTGQKPAPADLHPMLGCHDAAGTSVVLDLSKEPGWLGGDIAFFLMTPESHATKGTCASGDCCPSVARIGSGEGWVYYSQRAFNPDQQGQSSFIHLLVYDSKIWQGKFYFAWEDIFGGSDDEFTDLVTSVNGVECSGAGAACSTGKPGKCALGVTACSGGSTVTCEPAVAPSPETCNGVDDDCNGKVDDGATCPSPGDTCYQGRCVHKCGAQEFPCKAPLACDTKSGLCVDASCVGISCAEGTVCRAGSCGVPCAGVVCPHGQACVGDACVDLCAGAACASGQVCVGGVCIEGCGQCGGVSCAAPLACEKTSGACVDPSCAGGCPAGTWCNMGQCVDACSGAHCPDGQTCANGQCLDGSGAAPDGGLAPVGDDGGGGDDGGSTAETPWGSRSSGGCACEAAGGRGQAGLAAFVAWAIALAWRRRVCDRRARERH